MGVVLSRPLTNRSELIAEVVRFLRRRDVGAGPCKLCSSFDSVVHSRRVRPDIEIISIPLRSVEKALLRSRPKPSRAALVRLSCHQASRSSRLIQHAGPPVRRSAKLGLRPGLESAFCAHGNCSLENQHGSFLTVEVRCDHSFRESVSSQFRLVVDILPVASNRLGLQRPSSFGPPFCSRH